MTSEPTGRKRTKYCSGCGVELDPATNWSKRGAGNASYECRSCANKKQRNRDAVRRFVGRDRYSLMTAEEKAEAYAFVHRSGSRFASSRPRPVAPASQVSYPRVRELNAAPPRPRRAPRTRTTPNKAGFIYIIWHPAQYEQEGVLKIGLSGDLTKRISGANTWSFNGSFEYADYKPVNNMRTAEAFLHEHFAEQRQHGEWFKVDIGTARMLLDLVAEDFPLCADTHQLETTS